MAETKPEPKALAPIDEVYGILKKMENEFKLALPEHVPSEKFIRVVRTALQNSPELLAARRVTLYNACMRCAQDGLIPDKREAALVVFGKNNQDGGEVQYMPMVAGICKKARNSGEIATLDALEVFEKDVYESWVDEKGRHFKHVPARGADRGKPVLTYAYGITKDGGFYFEEIDEAQMAQIEKISRASDGPWKGPFRGEMKRKSAIRRLAKYRLPSSTDLESVMEADDRLFKPAEEPAAAPTEPVTKPRRVGEIIEAQAEKPAQAAPAQAAPAPTAKTADNANAGDIGQVPI
jgi:recombination protein RecT